MHPSITALLGRYPDLEGCADDVAAAFGRLEACFRRGGRLLVCGNGGSAADSEHIVGELMKGFRLPRPLPADVRRRLAGRFPDEGAYLAERLQGALPALSLVSQTSLLTAFANDVAPDLVFAQQVYGYGRAGDALLALSTSGGSSNVLHALRTARALGLVTVGLTGRSGGAMAELCDVAVRVPGDDAVTVQERHLPVYHTLCDMLEQAFFAEPHEPETP